MIARLRPVWHLAWYLTVICVAGGVAVAFSLVDIYAHPIDWRMVLLGTLTIGISRFSIKVPGQDATVSISEVFLFTSVLFFGPAAATMTAALVGLIASARQKHRRFYRTLFNIAQPALSTWIAGSLFFAIARSGPLLHTYQPGTSLVVPSLAMAAVYFILNTWLVAIAVALESGLRPYAIWETHALYLAVTYYAAASLATLAVEEGTALNFDAFALVAPILVLSYVSYKQFSDRSDDRDRHASDLEQLYQAAVETLAVAVDAKDQVTHGHIRRVQRHTRRLATVLGVTNATELKALEVASLLHDIGKLAVPDYVLNKPGALTTTEFETMKLHAGKGAMILGAVGFPYPVVPIVRHHHEQWNGRGYPDGISGEDIPLGARILAVVDCFDAVTSDRPYRRKLTDEAAVDILRARRGVFYDPRVVDTFISLLPELRERDREADLGPVISSVRASRSSVAAGATAAATSSELLAVHDIAAIVRARLGRLVPHAEFSVFAPHSDGEHLVCMHASTNLVPVLESLELKMGEGLSGWVAINRHTIVNSHPDLDLQDGAAELRLRACMSTPVFAFGHVAGVLTAYTPRADGFSPREVRIIGALAQEIGLEVARHDAELGYDLNSSGAAPAA